MRKGVWYRLLTVWYGLLTGLALLLAACGGQPPPGLTLAQPDLTLAGISPQNPAVVQGQAVTLTLTFTSQNGFQGQVSPSVLEEGQPVSWLSPDAVQRNLNVPRGQQVQETLEVQVAPNAPTGSRNLTVRAAYGNQVTERDLTLTVSEPGGGGGGDARSGYPDFTISLSPDSLTVQQGSSSQTTLTVFPENRFTGPVILALVAGPDQVPQGLTLSPGSVQVSGTSPVNQSLTLSAQPTTPTGTYRLKVQAISTARRLIREADLTLTVSAPGGGGSPDFTISLSPDSLAVQQGASGTTQLTLTPQGGFTGTVNLSLVGAPSGVTLSPTIVNVTGSNAVSQNLTVSVGSGVATGTYSLKVRGTSGSLTQEADLTLTVSTPGGGGYPDFTISLSPDSLTVQQGSSSQTTLTVFPENRFTGPVILALVAGPDQVPQGLTLSPGSVQVSGTSPVNQSLTLSAQPTTPTGTYRLKVQAISTARRLIREADLTLTVSEPGGGGVPPGTYSLTVRATSGSLTKTANLSLTVTASGGGGGGGGAGTTWTLRNLGNPSTA
jgi:hypothetical protein